MEKELTEILNKYSKENGSNTPDFILSTYMLACLYAFNQGVSAREQWYGRESVESSIVGNIQLGGSPTSGQYA